MELDFLKAKEEAKDCAIEALDMFGTYEPFQLALKKIEAGMEVLSESYFEYRGCYLFFLNPKLEVEYLPQMIARDFSYLVLPNYKVVSLGYQLDDLEKEIDWIRFIVDRNLVMLQRGTL